jgi:sugar phosphate isomerase/epimerase
MVRRIGYTEVEAVHGFWGSASIDELRRQLDKAQLKCTSVQQPPERLRSDMPGIVRDARTLGVQYVVCGYISGAFRRASSAPQPPGMFGPFVALSLQAFRSAAAEFNQWGRTLRKSGFKLGYHNHAYEFRLYGGRPEFDTLINETEAGLVDFEMDVFWVKRGGQDPIAYLKRYPRRFRLIHLKDMRRGTPVGDLSAGTSDEASVPLGAGILNMPAILRAAAEAHVDRYYVEDESAEAPEDIGIDFEYLKRIRF